MYYFEQKIVQQAQENFILKAIEFVMDYYFLSYYQIDFDSNFAYQMNCD